MTCILIQRFQQWLELPAVDVHDLDVVPARRDHIRAHIGGEEDSACRTEVLTASADWLLSSLAFDTVVVGFGNDIRRYYQWSGVV